MLKRNNTDVRPIPISRSQKFGHRESHFYPRNSLPDCTESHHAQDYWSNLSVQDRSGEMVDLSSLAQGTDVSQLVGLWPVAYLI